MWRMYVQQHQVFGPWYDRVQRQPGWVVKLAVMAAVLTIVVPVAVLTVAAILVGFIVFMALGIIATIVGTIRGLISGKSSAAYPQSNSFTNDGRQNVRILHR